MMKIPLRLVLLSVASMTVSLSGQAQADKAPFTVTISAETPVVKAGKQVIVDVTVTNISKHEIDGGGVVNEMLGMDTYDTYDIRDNVGNPAGKNTIKHPNGVGRGTLPIIIKPGESKVVSADELGIVYNLSRPGEYTIQLSRRVAFDPKAGVVKSNTITVTVTE